MATKKNNGKYVDGYVLVVPEKNTAAYKKMAKEAAKVWRAYGALDYKECIGEDMEPRAQSEQARPFPKLAKAGDGEKVWFSFIVFKNRKHRDSVNKKVMAYFEKKYGDKMVEMPFVMKKFSYGGFTVMVD